MKVLVVDDDPSQRTLLRVILESGGHEVGEAGDGIEALERLSAGGFQAVITDVLMPRMDGYRLCFEVRKKEGLRGIAILLYSSSYSSRAEEQFVLTSGADEIVAKPANTRQILEALERVVKAPPGHRAPVEPQGELDILKLYNEGLVQKVEEKNADLESAQRRLASTIEELRRSAHQVHLLLDSTAEGIYGLDRDCRITFSNAACASLLGFGDPSELMGENAHELVHHSGPERVLVPHGNCGICRTVVDGLGHSSSDEVLWRRDGTSFPAEYRSYPIRQDGQLLGAVVTFSDISERRRIEEALRKSEKRFTLAFHANPVATSIAEAISSKLLDVNDQFLQILGYTREEVIGRTSSDLGVWADPDTRVRVVGDVLGDVRVRDRKGRLRTKNGEIRDVIGSVVRIDLGDVPCVLSTFVDVTDRERALEALRGSEQRNRALMENAKDAIIVWALDGTVLEVNRAAEKLVGRERGQMAGRSLQDIVPPEERDAVRHAFADTIDGRSIQGFATRILRADGSRCPVEISAAVVEVGDSKVVQTSVRDVSERHHSQEELRTSEERYRLLFDASPQPLWVFDESSLAILAVNDAACIHYGYSRAEFLGLTIRDIRPPEEVARLEQVRATEPSEYQDSGVWKHRKKDGSVIEVEITSHPLVFDGHNAQLVLALDVTKRRSAENELRTSEERYRLLFDHNLAGVVRSTLAGRLLDCNDAIVRIYGYASREEFRSLAASDFYPDAEGRSAMLEKLRREGSLLNYEQKGRRKDGSELWVLCNYTLRESPDGDPVIQGTLIDITEKRRLEDQLRQSQKMEAVGQLAGGIAHDFNNILTTILGYGSLALERIDPKDPLFEEISEIQRAGERAAELTRNLLAFSRKQILEPRIIDLNVAISGMERMLGRVIGEDVRLMVRPGADLASVRADPGQIDQVLLNLAVNSRDAMPRGGSLTIETANVELDAGYARAHVGLPAGGAFVMLAVSDTGIGIDATTRAHIFEPFFTTKEQGKGTGLGLSTVYGIVKQSDGFIWCYSEPDVGTTFKIYLPQVREPAEAVMVSKPSAKPRGSETILLVEDEEALAKLARRALEKQGYRVFDARSGSAALEIILAQPGIDLLVTDVVMPGMSGGELARELQLTHPQMKVLFMSGYTDDAIVRHGILAPGVAFLQKPFTPASLAHKVREVLGMEGPTPRGPRVTDPGDSPPPPPILASRTGRS